MRVPSTEVQNSFGKYLKIATDQEAVIITKNGRDIASLAPCSEGLKISETGPAYGVASNKMSYQAFLELTKDSEERYELIDGELYLLDSPVYDHQAALGEIFGILYNWFKSKPCRPLFAPFDVTLSKGADNINVVQPDILVICDTDHIDGKGKYQGVPTLVVETLLPATRRKDMLKKLDLYLQTGVQEYWLVDPDKRTVFLYAFAADDIKDLRAIIGNGTVQSVCFPGLEIALSDIFSA